MEYDDKTLTYTMNTHRPLTTTRMHETKTAKRHKIKLNFNIVI